MLKKISKSILICGLFATIGHSLCYSQHMQDTNTTTSTIYDFTVLDIDGKEVSMEEYKGKVVLIVNVASKCGFTPQYEGLQDLYRMYKDQGLVILGFPCNQFGGQEPGNEESIKQGCILDYQLTFPMFSKVNVNGPDSHPLYTFLKESKSGVLGKKVKWNFTKFLVDRNGVPVKRFGSMDSPDKIGKHVVKLL